jgi:hypothetical protein
MIESIRITYKLLLLSFAEFFELLSASLQHVVVHLGRACGAAVREEDERGKGKTYQGHR